MKTAAFRDVQLSFRKMLVLEIVFSLAVLNQSFVDGGFISILISIFH